MTLPYVHHDSCSHGPPQDLRRDIQRKIAKTSQLRILYLGSKLNRMITTI